MLSFNLCYVITSFTTESRCHPLLQIVDGYVDDETIVLCISLYPPK